MLDLYSLKTGEDLINTSHIIQQIVSKIESREGTVNVPTASLNIYGTAVRDSFEKYLSSEHLSSSMFKEALITPLHYAFAKNDKSELERIKGTKQSFELGTFVHQAILEPTKFKRALIEPKYSLASLDGVGKAIEFWTNLINEEHGESAAEMLAKFEQAAINECGGFEKLATKKVYLNHLIAASSYETVTEENYYKIQIIKRNIDKYAGGIIYKLFKHSKREISFYYEEEDLKYRVRPDGLQFAENIGVNAILSIKSSATEDLKAFYYQAAKLNYDLTEAMYQDVISKVTGRPFNTTITLLLQTVPPFGVALLVWNKDDIAMGKYKLEQAKAVVREAESSGMIKGYDSYAEPENLGLIEMMLPQWNNKELLPTT